MLKFDYKIYFKISKLLLQSLYAACIHYDSMANCNWIFLCQEILYYIMTIFIKPGQLMTSSFFNLN